MDVTKLILKYTMLKKLTKIISIFLCFLLILEQSSFAQVAAQIGIPVQLVSSFFVPDRFRPLHLRSLEYNPQADSFKLLLDKGDFISNQERVASSEGKANQVLLENETRN